MCYNLIALIPEFNEDGNLPPGIHFATWDEFTDRFGQGTQRDFLMRGLKKAVSNLRIAGCKRIFIDGSFTTSKSIPNDYDACWEISGVNPTIVDPVLIDFSDPNRLLQKQLYRGDIFPARQIESSCGRVFLEFFQIDKSNGNAKGIIAINLSK